MTYPPQKGPYPGRNSQEHIGITGLVQQISRLVAEPLKPITPLRSHAKCRIALAGDKGTAKVHIDPGCY